MRVNAAEAMFERRVQNCRFCVKWGMENAGLVEPTAEQNVEKKKKRKKDKVRSAWISFAGRIVAQMVGAIATVALGVMVLHRYTSTETAPPAQELRYDASAPPAASGAQPGQPPVHVIILTPAMLGLRDADERIRSADRSCAPRLDGPATSAAHLDTRPLLSR